jgi:superfamily II DNA or RNA helicase
MNTKFFTNREGNALLSKLQGIFENLDVENFDAVVGYFRASGYFKVRPFLENVPQIRILVGINVDDIIARYKAKGLLYFRDESKTKSAFIEELRKDIENADYKKEVEDGIVRFISDIIDKKLQVRAHPTKTLHSKIYIFKPAGWNEHNSGDVITGSSNLTEAGLGGSEDTGNYEFNVLLKDYGDVKFASDEFELLWNESVDILEADVSQLKTKTYLRDDVTPEQIYYKFLMEYFGKSVEFDPNSVSDLPEGFKRLNYQLDAVEQGYRLMMKHNGVFLSDVVGTGKTIIGTLIAKKFFYQNGFPEHVSKTLIVVPPAMLDNWKDTIGKFGLANVEYITTGSLHHITNNQQKMESFDLVIVDEAHKFRNSKAEGFQLLEKICKSKAQRVIDEDVWASKKILLLSATPLNNSPEDILNQVLLFQDGKRTTLEVPNLKRYFTEKIQKWKELKKMDFRDSKPQIAAMYQDIRDKIIAPLTVRRTRTDLIEHPLYKDDLDRQGIKFPKIKSPHRLLYELDFELEELYDNTLRLLMDSEKGFSFNRYRAIAFLRPELKKKYKAADLASQQLAHIMRVLLTKRIDSSFFAFTQTLERFLQATRAMLKMWEDDQIVIAPNLKVNEYILEGREDELMDLIEKKKNTDPSITVCKRTDFEKEFIEGLKRDASHLESLFAGWSKINTDPKFDKFRGYLKKILNESYNVEKKLVVFSESKETTSYLVKKLAEAGITGVLDVDGGNLKSRKKTVKANFDANADPAERENEYHIIITTEVLAEGVNLHRANVIVNYDTPWNSTRLMQRIGRINRIGTLADEVHIFNFFPTSRVNDQIQLEQRAKQKLQAFHSALGEDSQIYSDEEEVDTFGLFDSAPAEDRDETLNYLMELRKLRKENLVKYQEIKKLPMRIRVAVNQKPMAGSTYCFLKNDSGSAFLLMDKNGVKESTFLAMAASLKACIELKAVNPIPDFHHRQIEFARDYFGEKLTKAATKAVAVDSRISPQEKKAMDLLNAFQSADFLDKDEIELIKLARACIDAHRFTGLPRELANLSSNIKKTPVSADEVAQSIIRILKNYPMDAAGFGRDEDEDAEGQAVNSKPKIVLSETYC